VGEVRAIWFTHRCDRCHAEDGVRFVDYYWVCEACAHRYVELLERERGITLCSITQCAS